MGLTEIFVRNCILRKTPGYLHLEFSTSTRYKPGETIQEYSSRVEKLLHDLCNISASKRTAAEAKSVHDFLKKIILTTYNEGLLKSIRNIIKDRNI